MGFVGVVLRLFSYLYHLAFALLLLGLSTVAFATGKHTLRLDMTPWSGKTLSWWLLGTSVAGLIALLLALRGKLRLLFPLYALFFSVMMIRGYFIQGYRFGGRDGLRFAMYLSLGGILALCGAWSAFRKKPAR